MQYTSIYPYFIIISMLLLSTAILSRTTFYSNELKRESSSRLASLDGLRGFLAFNVFFHHSVIMYFYYMTEKWQLPPSAFYTLLGQVSVPLFFMITGFLFWTKILESKLNIKFFFIRRFQRIAPLYIFTTSVVLVIVFLNTGFILNVDFFHLITQIIRWFSFAFLGTPDINGFKDTFTIESVYWTLRWEWIFYFSLPILAFFKNRSLGVIIFLILFSLISHNYNLLNFTFGILAATLIASNRSSLFQHLPFHVSSTIGFISLFFIFTTGYGVIQSLLMFLFFLSVLSGNTLFDLSTLFHTQNPIG